MLSLSLGQTIKTQKIPLKTNLWGYNKAQLEHIKHITILNNTLS